MKKGTDSVSENVKSPVVRPLPEAISEPPGDPGIPSGWRGLVHLLFGMGLVFVAYRAFRWMEDGFVPGDYEDPLFLFSAVAKSADRLGFWAFVVAAVAIFVVNLKGVRWSDLGCGTRFHYAAWVLIFIGIWTAAFYPYNFYWGHAHLADRLIILVLGVLCFRFPGVLPVFTIAMAISYWQWRVPLGDPENTNRKLIVDALLTLNGALLLWRWKWFPRPAVVLAVVSVVFIHYWIPGQEKFDISSKPMEWLLENRALNMMIAAFTLGWNVFWDQAGVVSVYQSMSFAEVPLKAFVIVVEMALVISFWRRPVFLAFTAGRILLHAGILFFSGDTFWNWNLLQVGLLAAFLWPSRGDVFVFGWRQMAASAVYVIATAHSHNANPLGWWDSRLSERYNVVAVTEGGERELITPFFFEPFDFLFIQSKFHFTVRDDKILTRTYGAIHDEEAAREFRKAYTPEEARRLIDKWGKEQYSEKMSGELDEFIQRWFQNYREQKDSFWVKFFRVMHPPPHALAFPGRGHGTNGVDEEDEEDGGAPLLEVYQGDKPVQSVEFEFERTFFDGAAFHLMDRRVVRTMKIEK